MPKDHFARVRRIGAKLPGVEEGVSYGTPCLRMRKKLLTRLKEDGESLVLKTANLDEKEVLLESDPAIFYETDHYKGWPALLIRLPKISDAHLAALIEQAGAREAGKKLLAQRPRSGAG